MVILRVQVILRVLVILPHIHLFISERQLRIWKPEQIGRSPGQEVHASVRYRYFSIIVHDECRAGSARFFLEEISVLLIYMKALFPCPRPILTAFVFLMAACAGVTLSAPAVHADELSVVVRESKLRSAPSHWSSVAGDLAYGDILSRLGTEGSWERVSVSSSGGAAGKTGFVHTSTVSVRTVVLRAGVQSGSIEVDPANVVLAGKGFNSDVEDLYRSQKGSLDFTAINSWEKQSVSDVDLRNFLQQGGLAE